jgi:hypothetical protein
MQTPIQVLNIGADVAKDEIIVVCSEGGFPVRKLANQRTALLPFLKSLPPGSRIGMESTGIDHELFANLAHKLGFIVFVLNPKDEPLCQRRRDAWQDRSCRCTPTNPNSILHASQKA